MGCRDSFAQRLRERGFRFTPQREMVLEAMHRLKGHLSVEDIFGEVQLISSTVDISTVYRTLEVLQSFGMVSVVDLDDGQNRYELISDHGLHHHLLCRHCGRLYEVGQEQLLPLVEYLAKEWSFAVELGQLVIPGTCRSCLNSHQDASPGDAEQGVVQPFRERVQPLEQEGA